MGNPLEMRFICCQNVPGSGGRRLHWIQTFCKNTWHRNRKWSMTQKKIWDTELTTDQTEQPLVAGVRFLRFLRRLGWSKVLPSGKHTKNYGPFQWVNP